MKSPCSTLLLLLGASCSPFEGEQTTADEPTVSRDTPTVSRETLPDASTAATTPQVIGCNRNADCVRVVFVTTSTYTGNLGGLNTADDICTVTAADNAAPRVAKRTFRAWLSDANNAVSARLVHGTAAYIRPDGTTIAANWDEFASEAHRVPIDIDARGTRIADTDTALVWTSSSPVGKATVTHTCGDWYSNTATGWIGWLTEVGAKWTYNNTSEYTCGTNAHLYCVED